MSKFVAYYIQISLTVHFIRYAYHVGYFGAINSNTQFVIQCLSCQSLRNCLHNVEYGNVRVSVVKQVNFVQFKKIKGNWLRARATGHTVVVHIVQANTKYNK